MRRGERRLKLFCGLFLPTTVLSVLRANNGDVGDLSNVRSVEGEIYSILEKVLLGVVEFADVLPGDTVCAT